MYKESINSHLDLCKEIVKSSCSTSKISCKMFSDINLRCLFVYFYISQVYKCNLFYLSHIFPCVTFSQNKTKIKLLKINNAKKRRIEEENEKNKPDKSSVQLSNPIIPSLCKSMPNYGKKDVLLKVNVVFSLKS